MNYFLVQIDDRFGIGRGYFRPNGFLGSDYLEDFWWHNMNGVKTQATFESEEYALRRLKKYLTDRKQPVVKVVRKVNVKELMNEQRS